MLEPENGFNGYCSLLYSSILNPTRTKRAVALPASNRGKYSGSQSRDLQEEEFRPSLPSISNPEASRSPTFSIGSTEKRLVSATFSG